MKIAYISPLSPLKSGISDYSEELIPELNKLVEIDLFIDGFQIQNEEINNNYNVYDIEMISEYYEGYDFVVYHMGNNVDFHLKIYDMLMEYPGIVVLHDFSINGFMAGRLIGNTGNLDAYSKLMYQNYGTKGQEAIKNFIDGKTKPVWETNQCLTFPLNEGIVEKSRGVIVHSKFAMNKLIENNDDLPPIGLAPLQASDIESIENKEIERLREKYLPNNTKKIIFGAYGYISEPKRIKEILSVVKQMVDQGYDNFKFIIVGRAVKTYNMKEVIKSNKLQQYVSIIEDASLDEFKDYIKLSDVCIGLRYPTAGESSASVFRILGYGKPCIVTNIGSFAEVPDECCIKVNIETELEDIYDGMTSFMDDKSKIRIMSKSAIEYIQNNHRIEHTAKAYYSFMDSIKSGGVYNNNYNLNSNVSECLAEKIIGLTDNLELTYVEEICEKVWEIL